MRRSGTDWELVKYVYAAGDMSLKALAEHLGLAQSSVEAHSTRDGWAEARRVARQKLLARVREEIEGEAAQKLREGLGDLASFQTSAMSLARRLPDALSASLDDWQARRSLWIKTHPNGPPFGELPPMSAAAVSALLQALERAARVIEAAGGKPAQLGPVTIDVQDLGRAVIGGGEDRAKFEAKYPGGPEIMRSIVGDLDDEDGEGEDGESQEVA